MPGPVPRNIVEVDRFLIVAVTVATEFQSPEWRFGSDLVSHQMIQRSVPKLDSAGLRLVDL